MATESIQETVPESLIQDSKCNQRQTPILLFLFASAYIVSSIVLSNIREWLFVFHIITACFVFVFFIAILLKKIKVVRPDAIHIIFIIWGIFGLIGSYDTLNLISVYGKLLTLFQLILLSYLLYALAIHMGTTEWIEWNCIIAVIISMAWVFLETGGNFGAERISGTQGNANLFGFVLLLSLVVSLKLLRDYSSIFIKILILVNMASIFPFLLATGSRKGVIGFFLILAVAVGYHLFFEYKEKRARSVLFAFLLIVLTLTIGLPMLQESFFFKRLQNLERFARGEDLVVQEQSLSHRMDLYTRGFELALRNPLFGVGHDQFRYYDNSLRAGKVSYSYSHSNIIEVLANTGFLGFIIYHSAYVLIAIRIFSVWNKNNSESVRNYLYLSMLIGMLIVTYDLFSVKYYNKEYWITLTMVCSFLKLAQQSVKNGNVSQT